MVMAIVSDLVTNPIKCATMLLTMLLHIILSLSPTYFQWAGSAPDEFVVVK